MLKDADFKYFPAVYVVCGYTDMRCGIDSLAAIIERKYKVSLFVPNTLFLFCGRSSTRIKGLLWEGDGFLLLYKRVEQGRFVCPETVTSLGSYVPNNTNGLCRALRLIHLYTTPIPVFLPDSIFNYCAKQRFLITVFPAVYTGAVHSLSRPLCCF